MANKKNDHTELMLLGIVGVVILLIFNSPKSETNESINIQEQESASPNSQDIFIESNINLCSLLTPYVVLFNLQNQCNLNGGTWTCGENNIGCYSMTNPILDCDLLPVQTALSQCRSADGNAYCDPQNIYCRQ